MTRLGFLEKSLTKNRLFRKKPTKNIHFGFLGKSLTKNRLFRKKPNQKHLFIYKFIFYKFIHKVFWLHFF